MTTPGDIEGEPRRGWDSLTPAEQNLVGELTRRQPLAPEEIMQRGLSPESLTSVGREAISLCVSFSLRGLRLDHARRISEVVPQGITILQEEAQRSVLRCLEQGTSHDAHIASTLVKELSLPVTAEMRAQAADLVAHLPPFKREDEFYELFNLPRDEWTQWLRQKKQREISYNYDSDPREKALKNGNVAIEDLLIGTIEKGDRHYYSHLKDSLRARNADLTLFREKTERIKDEYCERVLEDLREAHARQALFFYEELLCLDPHALRGPAAETVHQALTRGLRHCSEKLLVDQAIDLAEVWMKPGMFPDFLKDEDIQSAARSLAVHRLTSRKYLANKTPEVGLEGFLRVLKAFDLPAKTDPQMQATAQEYGSQLLIGIGNEASEGRKEIFDVCDSILSEFELPRDTFKAPARRALLATLTLSDPSLASLQARYALPDDLASYAEELASLPYLQSMTEHWSVTTIPELRALLRGDQPYTEYVQKTPEVAVLLAKTDVPTLQKLRITTVEAEQLLRANVPLASLDHDAAFAALCEHALAWQDVDNVQKPFQEGAAIFSAKRMLQFLDRKGLSRHDGLQSFGDIIKMFRASTLSADQFFNNILLQVQQSDEIDTDFSNQHLLLNLIAQGFHVRMPTAAEAEQYADLDGIQTLVEQYTSPRQIFASWTALKQYTNLAELLERREAMEALRAVKNAGKTQLYDYLSTLAFFPGTKINMKHVMQLLQAPEEFISHDEVHSAETHELKKPSHYVHIPHLDLTAEDLRDGLVEGKIDALQVFPPMQIRYKIPVRGEAIFTPRHALQEIQAAQAQWPKCFGALKKIFEAHGSNDGAISAYLEGGEISAELESAIEKLLMEKNWFQIPRPQVYSIVATLHPKSSPHAVLAGNQTATCDTFGSGKRNVFMFNPNCCDFTVQIERKGELPRTIAQSLLTKDKDIGEAIPPLLQKMRLQESMDAIIPESVLHQAQGYVAADNVEAAMNYLQGAFPSMMEDVYRDFFREYLARHAAKLGLHPSKVPIGMQYSKIFQTLPEEPNTFAPVAPAGYSDNIQDNVKMLDVSSPPRRISKEIIEMSAIPGRVERPLGDQGVSDLTFEDSLAVAHLEGKAYADAPGMRVHLHNLENGLIAKDINNAIKDRPNMSLKYRDAKGKMRGYLLAYEGKLAPAIANLPTVAGKARVAPEEPVLYIADLASDLSLQSGSGEERTELPGNNLVRAFLERYKREYLDRGKYVPIFMEAREKTSYRIIQRQLKRLAGNIDVEIEELESMGYEGPDEGNTRHRIILRPRPTAPEKTAA